ncbi:MAG: hypothetical protein WCO96_09340 [Actinomycetes bacterium]
MIRAERQRRVPVGLIAAIATGCSFGVLPASAMADAATPISPKSVKAKQPPRGEIRDRVLPKRPRNMARAAAVIDARGRGGEYTVTVAGKTRTVRVYLSSAFSAVTDKAEIDRRNTEWAEEFTKMEHGSELSTLTVYVSPLSEITEPSVCGKEAVSCYDPNDGSMYLVGEELPDGTGVLQVAMHEYGHHVATSRLNTPWDASGWGPKYWASAQRVCSWVRRGKMWPFDQDTHYADNPGEVWAETYRIVAAQAQGLEPDPWEILNPNWDPISKPAILAAARRDVLSPWRGRVRSSWSGRLDAKTRRTVTVRVPANADGLLDTRLSTSGNLKAKLKLVPRGGSLADGRLCGASAVDATITRRSGAGRWGFAARYAKR